MTIPSVLSLKTTLMAAALSAVVSGGVCGWVGWSLRDRDYQSHLKDDMKAAEKAQKDARKVEGKGQEITTLALEEGAKAEAEIRYVTKTIYERMPIYVTPEIDRSVTVPTGFGLLHDYAASNTPLPSGPSPIDPSRPSGIELSALAGTITDNYGQCYLWKAERDIWRKWHREQSAAWPVKTAAPSETEAPSK